MILTSPHKSPGGCQPCNKAAPTAHPGPAPPSGTPSLQCRACAGPSYRRSTTVPLLVPAPTAPPPPRAIASSDAPHLALSAGYPCRSPDESHAATLSSLCSTPLTAPQSVGKSDCLLR